MSERLRLRALVTGATMGLAACAAVAGLDDFAIVDSTDGGADAALGHGDAAGVDVSVPGTTCTPPALTAPATAAHAAAAPMVDGDLGEWPCSSFVALDTTSAGYASGTSSASAQFAVQWDATGVWFACRVSVANPIGTSPLPYANDACELYIGLPPPDGAAQPTDFHFVIDWQNQAASYNDRVATAMPLPPGVVTATKSSATGFDVELFVPASVLGYIPVAGLMRLFDVQLDEDGIEDGGVTRTGALWAYRTADAPAGNCGASVDPQLACDTLLWGELDFAP